MKITELTELLDSAYYLKKDVFVYGAEMPGISEIIALSAEIKTVVVLPSKLYPSSHGDIAVYSADCRDFSTEAKLILAESGLFHCGMFYDYLVKNGFGRVIVPFAELADECEYGFSSAYACLGEAREENTGYIQLAALFTLDYCREKFEFIYGVRGGICVDASVKNADFRVIRCEDGEMNGRILRETEKSAFMTSFVFFSTRTAAGRFSDFAKARGANIPVITGQSTSDEIKNILSAFVSGRIKTVAGTKSLLSVFPVARADRVFISGVPFSPAHLYRMLSSGERGTVIISDKSPELAEKLIREYCTDYYPEIADELIKEKNLLLEKTAAMLK